MEEMELLERIASALAEKLQPGRIPLQIDLWDISTIAQYLKREPRVVRERIACLPDFPKAIRLPSGKGRGHPLYSAAEVMAWAKGYQAKSSARRRD